MPRTLPWLTQAKSAQSKANSSSPAPAPKRKRTATPDGDLVDEDLNSTGVQTPARRERQRLARSPSTSPPPAPPDVEYMHEGFAADDIWMMVEDEFFSTAQSFTQHIHHAEYVRLKNLAKARGERTLQAIARPTDGRTEQSTGVKMEIEAEEKAQKAKGVLKQMTVENESDGSEDADYMLDPQLAGLMTGSQRSAQDLTGLAKTKAKTRAAAGFTKNPQKARPKPSKATSNISRDHREVGVDRQPASDGERSDDEDEDLDSGPGKRVPTKPTALKARHIDTTNGAAAHESKSAKASAAGLFKPFAEGSRSTQQVSTADELPRDRPVPQLNGLRKEHPPTGNERNSDGTTPSYSSRSQATLNFLAKRRAREAAKQKSADRETKQKAKSTVDVPTFAI